ncbi:hypothetical protein BT63DRAFT_457419 [Microthyrium microscopicum]|uniref:Uncharacterized protein n=1 Tax=Microthyrium microscopicum TaxID=703497 RepID=A0A6A6U928_9PEZI|nr:hypothetical protein BT63DRAFT_457419 [Microthyrium microscopicum]
MSKFQVQAGCELMLQPLPEKPLVDAHDFQVVYDDNSDPAIFGLGNDGSLILIAKDGRGNNTLVDLRKQLGLFEFISAIGIRQDPTTKTIYFALGMKSSPRGKVYVAAPFIPKSESKDKPWYLQIDQSILLNGTGQLDLFAHNFMFGTTSKIEESGDSDADTTSPMYPFLAIVTSETFDGRKDVLQLEVNLKIKSWVWSKDFSYPYHFNEMKDICGGTTHLASGVYGLNLTGATPQVTFASRKPKVGGVIKANLAYPEKPQSETTTVSNTSAQPSQPTLKDPLLKGLTQLHVAQDHSSDRNIVIWALNGDGNVVYQPAHFFTIRDGGDDNNTDGVMADGPTVPLLSLKQRISSPEKVKRFNAMIYPVTGARQIYVLTGDGKVSWLQQDPKTRLWSEEQFRIPDDSSVEDINTYTCRIRIVNEKHQPQPDLEIHLSASSHTRASINGHGFHLSPDPRSVQTDSDGVITVIMPANSLRVPNLEIKGDQVEPATLNPSDKAMEKLSNAAENGKLKDAKIGDKAVFPKLDDTKADAAKKIGEAYHEQKAKPTTSQQVHKRSVPMRRGFVSDLFPDWECLHGLKQTLDKMESAVIQAGELVLTTIVNGIKQIYTFVIKTIEHALEAINTILDWIAEKIEDALVWLASKLNWENILDIKDIFNEVVLSSLSMGSTLALHGQEIVNGFFDDIEKKIGDLHVPPIVPEDQKGLFKPKKEGEEKMEHTNNPCFNWATHQINHGSVKKDTNGISGSGEADMDIMLDQVFTTIIEPMWKAIKGTFDQIVADLKGGFDSNQSFLDILKNIGVDVIAGIIKVLRTAVNSLLGLFVKMFDWMKDIMQKEVNIFVLTKLYAKITHGGKLTMLNLFSLLLAVPTSWIYWFTTGKDVKQSPEIQQFLTDLRNKKWSSKQVPAQLSASSHLSRRVQNAAKDPSFFERVADVFPVDDRNRMKACYHMAFMIISTGKFSYTLFDMLKTPAKWTKARLDTGQPPKYEVGFEVFASLLGAIFSFPLEKYKSNRPETARTLRVISWCITAPLTVIKSVSRPRNKPPLCVIIGIVDIGMYTSALVIEKKEGNSDQDSTFEIASRLLSGAWALSSGMNGYSGGTNEIGYAVSGVVGVLLAVSNTVVLQEQWRYWQSFDTSKGGVWTPPSVSTSLGGAM